MRNYENRVRCAVNTPDLNGNFALWQGGMEPNIPVGSEEGVTASMKKAVAGAEREQREGANMQPPRFKSISEFHQLRELPKPEHPLISVINLELIRHLPANEMSLCSIFIPLHLKGISMPG